MCFVGEEHFQLEGKTSPEIAKGAAYLLVDQIIVLITYRYLSYITVLLLLLLLLLSLLLDVLLSHPSYLLTVYGLHSATSRPDKVPWNATAL